MFTDSNPSANKIRYYSGFIMVVIYLALGLLFLFTDIAENTFPANRKPIGVIFIVYGIFRAIVSVQKIRKANRE
jgi:uncharacterized membrane protein HdeD (DUF308 family)